jgi:hypothetical protein
MFWLFCMISLLNLALGYGLAIALGLTKKSGHATAGAVPSEASDSHAPTTAHAAAKAHPAH